MSGFKLTSFGPRIPALDVRSSPIGTAQVAEDCRLYSHAIVPWRDTFTLGSCPAGSNTVSLYQYDPDGVNSWMTWDTDVNVQAAPVSGDLTARAYVTGLGAPRAFDNTQVTAADGFATLVSSYLLGVPAPLTAPTTTLGAGGAGTANARTYVTTLVTGWGEEGPPSPPSTVLPTVLPGQLVTVDDFETPPTGDYNFTLRRIYRSASGATTSALQLLAELPIATTTYADTTLDEDLGALLVSDEWDPPPSDMVGIIALANNVLAGFSGKDICFSEPGYPHAWPVRYRKTVPVAVVAIGSYGSTVVVGTEANPYVIVCNTPATASIVPLPALQACVSKRSMVRTDSGVAYASPDGIVHVSASGYSLLTEGILERDSWQLYEPANMHIHVHGGRFFVFSRTGSTAGVHTGLGFILDHRSGGGLTTVPFYASAAAIEARTGALYLSIHSESSGTGMLEEWEGAAIFRVATWRSTDIPAPREVNMGAARVVFAPLSAEEETAIAEEYAVALADYIASSLPEAESAGSFASTELAEYEFAGGADTTVSPTIAAEAQVVFSLYGDGVLRATKVVTAILPFTLPGGYTALDWSVELSSNRVVRAVMVAPTMIEVAQL